MADIGNNPTVVLKDPPNLDPSMYEAIFRTSIDGILIADNNGLYIDVNDAACEITGRPREQLIGQQVGTFVQHPGEARMLWDKAMQSGPYARKQPSSGPT